MKNPPKTHMGNGNETHQVAGAGRSGWLTTNQGIPISDNQNSLVSHLKGGTLLEDFVLREKIFHFDHERIPERIVHARGSAAHGYFQAYDSLSDVTTAALFQKKGQRTPVFTRFSTVAGGAGSVDTPRDVRGFAVKFYTEMGNWDLVGNNIPVFFIQDAMKFPDLVHAVKMEADRGFPQAGSAHDTFWDWASLTPESTHMLMWAMSDRTLPRSLRMMDGFGVHTFKMVNAKGKVTLVKFHWKPKLGVQSTLWDEAVKLQSADNDYHRRDLWEAIERGAFPEWELGIQAFDEKFAAKLPFDVLDPTKLIPEELVPLRMIGKMVLNRNPDNLFAETEQVAFCPSNIVPGLDFSNDPLLQGRLFSYLDTQKSRLGTANFHQIPINAPKCPFANFQRDGQMQMAVPKGRATYEPNSLEEHGERGGPRETPSGFITQKTTVTLVEHTLRTRPESFADHYSQARMFWLSLTENEQAHIVSSFVFELSKVQLAEVPSRVLARIRNVDDTLATRVAKGLGIKLPSKAPGLAPINMKASAALSIQKNMKAVLTGRNVGILIADGTEQAVLKQLIMMVERAGASAFLIAPRIKGIKLDDGSVRDVDGQLAGTPSHLFDAVALVLNAKAAKQLCLESAAVQFVADAFGHLKAVGHTPEAASLLTRAHVTPDAGVTDLGPKFIKAAKLRYWDREPLVRNLH
jgi:catalase